MPLDEDTVRLAKANNLATVVTLMQDGQPQALPTWIDADDDHILVNTTPQRQRTKNVARDPRITVLIQSRDRPYDWAEVRGRVIATVTGDQARKHLRELALRYEGMELDDDSIGSRVILQIIPDKINAPEKVPGHPSRTAGSCRS